MPNNHSRTYSTSATRITHRTDRPVLYLSLALLASIGSVLAGCADAPTISGPVAESAPVSAKGPFDGPRSVPTRGRILFHSSTTGDQELYSMLEDGTSIVRLTHSPGVDGPGAFSPDGRRIAFVSERDGTSQMYVMNPDGSGIKRVTNLTSSYAAVGRPSWSPDGKSIAFAIWTDATNQEDIFIMNANGGSGPVLIASGASRELEPAYSADGTRLAFTSDRTGMEQIWIMNADGSNPTQFSNCAAPCINPAWSPDGARLAFAADDQGVTSLHVYFVATKTFNFGVQGVSMPVWAPDGVKLAVNNNTNGQDETAIINADGSNLQNITNFGVFGALATSWSR